jgi:hypothetical protein
LIPAYTLYPRHTTSTHNLELQVINLSKEISNLIYLKTSLAIYERTEQSIRNSPTTAEEVNMNYISWLQSKSRIAALNRSIVRDFRRLSDDMKRTFVVHNRVALKENGFRPTDDGMGISRPGSWKC